MCYWVKNNVFSLRQEQQTLYLESQDANKFGRMLTSRGTPLRTPAFRGVSETILKIDMHKYFEFKRTLNLSNVG